MAQLGAEGDVRACPAGCGAAIADRAIVCNVCGWEAPHRPAGDTREAEERRQENERAVAAAKAEPGSTTGDLTEQQWYAVCKFFPGVARRARRKALQVGPRNPLDAQVKLGPMFGGRRIIDAEELAEREAIQHAEAEIANRQPFRIGEAS